jgi:hypothetical protein
MQLELTVRIGFSHAFFQILSRSKVTILIFVASPAFPERSSAIRRKGADDALEKRACIYEVSGEDR